MAYIGDTPSTRTSSLDVPQQGPISQFDFQLKVLSDSYISFFNERRRIEETYVDSLIKLHARTRTFDLYLDDRVELSSSRKAWGELRDDVDRETQTRQAFLNSLSEDVIAPLQALKDAQERIRKRVKEDIKDSSQAHTDFIENQLPRLKRAYVRKAQEVEDYRSAVSKDVNANHAPVYAEGNLASSRSNASSPPPLRPVERRASLGSSRRDRSPSSSQTTFQDIAQHGKRQLNQLMGLLDKNGTMRNAESLRMVRVKRETDEADREYRKAVIWAETLRLRRVKILQAGYNSLETLFYELAGTVKRTLTVYADSVLATTSTQATLATHARAAIEKVSPRRDQELLAAPIPQLFKAAVPPQIFYHNYEVGVCKDLTFGISLSDYAAARALPEGYIPRVLGLCIAEVDARGLDVEGIYRISGRHAVVSALQHKLERNEKEFKLETDDVHAVASLLKAYLRSLPEPVFKFPLQERIKHTEDTDEHRVNGYALLRSKIRRLPAINRQCLRAVVEHLARVAAHSQQNKMDSKNISIVFGTVIFGEEDAPQGESDLIRMASWKDTVMEDLVENAHTLFQFNEDRPPSQMHAPQSQRLPQQASPRVPPSHLHQPPQPPPQILQPTTDSALSAGASVTPLPPVDVPQPKLGIQHIQPSPPVDGPRSAPTVNREQDFTPKLPPLGEIQHSIHPSARSSGAQMNPPTVVRVPRERPESMPPPRREVIPVHDALQAASSDAQDTLRSRPPSLKHLLSDVTVDEQFAGDAIAAMSFSRRDSEPQTENVDVPKLSRHPSSP